MNRIVLGVDHSHEAEVALRFALDDAELRSAPLRVVHSRQHSSIGSAGVESIYPAVGVAEDGER